MPSQNYLSFHYISLRSYSFRLIKNYWLGLWTSFCWINFFVKQFFFKFFVAINSNLTLAIKDMHSHTYIKINLLCKNSVEFKMYQYNFTVLQLVVFLYLCVLFSVTVQKIEYFEFLYHIIAYKQIAQISVELTNEEV